MHQLSIQDLGFQRDDLFLFQGMNFEAQSGDAVQVSGPNGVGKTTLLKILVGLVHASEGAVVWRKTEKDCPIHESLLYLGHDSGVKLSLTAIENLRWYFGINGNCAQSSNKEVLEDAGDVVGQDNVLASSDNTSHSLDDSKLLEALSWAGLKSYEDVICHEMSAGQRRRVALARLFLSTAPLWVLDEPFTAIDIAGVAKLEQLLAEHCAKGGMVLFTTHQQSSLKKLKFLDVAEFKPRSPFPIYADDYVGESSAESATVSGGTA